MALDDQLERESDIEELRRVALALHAQLQQTIRQLKRKCDQLAFYTGNKAELQQTLALIEQLTGQAKGAEAAAKNPPPRTPPKPRTTSGPTPQPMLPRVPLVGPAAVGGPPAAEVQAVSRFLRSARWRPARYTRPPRRATGRRRGTVFRCSCTYPLRGRGPLPDRSRNAERDRGRWGSVISA